jgi:hypothetical protein
MTRGNARLETEAAYHLLKQSSLRSKIHLSASMRAGVTTVAEVLGSIGDLCPDTYPPIDANTLPCKPSYLRAKGGRDRAT